MKEIKNINETRKTTWVWTYTASNDTTWDRQFDDTVSGEGVHRSAGKQGRGRLSSAQELQQNGDGRWNESRAVNGESKCSVLTEELSTE